MRNVNELLAFAAALIALRLAGDLFRRWRQRRAPEFAAWAAGLAAYAGACAALAWAAAAGWDDRVFRVYYLLGGLVSVPLLAAGSLARAGRRWAAPLVLAWVGLATGVAISEPLTTPVTGSAVPAAQEHLDWLPARLLAVAGNSLGTIAIVATALLAFRRRPFGNALVIAGIAVAAAGSAVFALGEAGTAAYLAVAAVLLYAGFAAPTLSGLTRGLLTSVRGTRLTP
jgi:hypothetical protein